MGVVRKEDGSLHFFVNGVPQGPAAWNVPPSVYAVVDLYGQAAQATIMDDLGERNKERVEMGGWMVDTLKYSSVHRFLLLLQNLLLSLSFS